MKKRKIFVFSKEDICFSGKRYFFGKKKRYFSEIWRKGEGRSLFQGRWKKRGFFFRKKKEEESFFPGLERETH